MKVLFDHQAFSGMRYGGIARYHFELMNYFYQNKNVDFDLALRFSNNEYIANASFSNHHNFAHFFSYLTTNRIISFVNRLNSARMIRESDFDLFHPTYYHKYFLQHIGNKPFVFTFHDCTNELYHQQYPALGGNLFELKQELLNRASRIIAVSNFTKKEILSYFNVAEEKIDVIYHGTSFEHCEEDITPAYKKSVAALTDVDYLLFVGNRADFKNFDKYIQAIQPIFVKFPEVRLVCAGGKTFNNFEKELLNKLGISNRIIHVNILSDFHLKSLYTNALAFVFPSIIEGFGIPILEAFASNCPVLLSNTSCFPEIAEDAGSYFDPFDAESMLNKTIEILENQQLRTTLIQKGKERLKDFSLEKTATQTQKTYQLALSQYV